tara:strand:+ start:3519 stop:3752 length:234 start_codon:yes stop_codon:yes gene_type:complete
MSLTERLAKLGVTLQTKGPKAATPTNEQTNVTTLRAILMNPATGPEKANEVLDRLEYLATEHGIEVSELLTKHKSFS